MKYTKEQTMIYKKLQLNIEQHKPSLKLTWSQILLNGYPSLLY